MQSLANKRNAVCWGRNMGMAQNKGLGTTITKIRENGYGNQPEYASIHLEKREESKLHLEAGCRGMAVELWERAERYIKEVMKMDEGRWPKKCLKEEIRGIINGDTTKWGKELKQAMEGVGKGTIRNKIRNGDQEELDRRIRRVV